MLSGVGGRTIEEAKERMSFAEYQRWAAYVRKRGSLHLGRRVESAAALLATLQVRAAGGKAELLDFAPHEDQPEPTIEDVALLLMGVGR